MYLVVVCVCACVLVISWYISACTKAATCSTLFGYYHSDVFYPWTVENNICNSCKPFFTAICDIGWHDETFSPITHNVAIASLVPLPFQKANWSFPKWFIAFALASIRFVSTLISTYAACPNRLIVLKSLHSVAFGFFSNGIITVCRKSVGHFPVS